MTATPHRDALTTSTFNLIDQPWIPCRTVNGARTLSIRDIFDGSNEALAIVGDSPSQDYAVLRVLLAIFWRAHHHQLAEELKDRRALAQFEWDEWWTDTRTQLNATGVDDTVLDYLATVHNRFDLLEILLCRWQTYTRHQIPSKKYHVLFLTQNKITSPCVPLRAGEACPTRRQHGG